MENQLNSFPTDPAEEPADGLPPAGRQRDPQLERIHDYEVLSLAEEDVLRSILGASNGGLMTIGRRLELALENALAGRVPTIEIMEKLRPSIEALLKIRSLSERYTQLDFKLAGGNRSQRSDVLPAVPAPPLTP